MQASSMGVYWQMRCATTIAMTMGRPRGTAWRRVLRRLGILTCAGILTIVGIGPGSGPAWAQQASTGSERVAASGQRLGETRSGSSGRDDPTSVSTTDLDASAEYYRGYRDAMRDAARLAGASQRWRSTARRSNRDYEREQGSTRRLGEESRNWPNAAARTSRPSATNLPSRDRTAETPQAGAQLNDIPTGRIDSPR